MSPVRDACACGTIGTPLRDTALQRPRSTQHALLLPAPGRTHSAASVRAVSSRPSMHRLARSGWVQSRRAAAGTLAWPAAPPLAAPISSVVWQAVRLASSRSGEASAPERPEGAPRKRKVVRKVVVRRKRATEAAAPEPAPGPVSSASSAAAAAALADDTVPGVLPAAPKAAAANSTHAGPGPPPTDGDGESGYIAFTKDLEGELARQDHGESLARQAEPAAACRRATVSAPRPRGDPPQVPHSP